MQDFPLVMVDDEEAVEGKAEHEKFAMNAWPRRILGDHLEDQLSNPFGKPLPTDRLSRHRDQPPIQTETSPMPADDSLRSHDDQRILPARPDTLDHYPKQFL
jgi:hypothetical protein